MKRLQHLNCWENACVTLISILRYLFAIPHLMSLLCFSPAFLSDSLKVYDEVLCSLLSTVLNVSVDVSCPSWTQSSLPVRLNGLGIRSAEQLAPSCYLSSVAASCCLIHLILSHTDISPSPSLRDDAISLYSHHYLPQMMAESQFRESGTIPR